MKTIKYEILLDNELKTSSFDTKIYDIDFFTGFCIFAMWNGVISGKIKILVSNDKQYWTDLSGSEKDVVPNSSHMWNYDGVAHFRYLKVFCNITSGSAIFYINCNSKGM